MVFEVVRGVVLVAAVVATGLLAGVFFAFAVAVMPGLARVGDRVFVEVMQRVNGAILNGWFLAVFLGAPVLSLLAVVVYLGSGGVVVGLLAGGFVLCGVSLVVTVRGSVPLNDALAAAGPVERMADPGGVRRRFEVVWVRRNVVRTVVSGAALVCLVVGAVAV